MTWDSDDRDDFLSVLSSILEEIISTHQAVDGLAGITGEIRDELSIIAEQLERIADYVTSPTPFPVRGTPPTRDEEYASEWATHLASKLEQLQEKDQSK